MRVLLKLDKRNRITIPVATRRKLGLMSGDLIVFEQVENEIGYRLTHQQSHMTSSSKKTYSEKNDS